MGAMISHLRSSIFPKEERWVIIWGLWYSGKTTILYKQLKSFGPLDIVSTVGFNVELVRHKGTDFLCFDLGGRDKLRERWRSYFSRVAAIIYVVDSTEVERLDDAAYELSVLLDATGPRENGVPLLVYANKQDLEGAKSAQEISEALRLGELQNRRWKTVACCAIDGTGITEGMDWLVQAVRGEKE